MSDFRLVKLTDPIQVTSVSGGLVPKGAWNSGTAYVVGDSVSLSGSSYICILGHTNQTPPNATYWQLLANKGDTGATGATGATGPSGALSNSTGSSTDNAITRFDGTTGNIVQNSVVTVADDGTTTLNMGAAGQITLGSIFGAPFAAFFNDQGDANASTVFGATGNFQAGAGGASAIDTTLARGSAGVWTLAANKMQSTTNPTVSDDFTRKGYVDAKIITASTTNAPGATPTTAVGTSVLTYIDFTGLNTAITSMTTNLSGSASRGDKLWYSFTDDGTARAITWGSSFEASTIALPTTTVISTRLDVGFIWNTATSKWRCIAVS